MCDMYCTKEYRSCDDFSSARLGEVTHNVGEGSFYVGLLTVIPYEQFSSENESTIFLLPNIHILPLLLCISYCSSGDHKTFDKKKLIVFLILATAYRSTMQPFNNYDELRWICIVTVIVFFHNLLPYLDMT